MRERFEQEPKCCKIVNDNGFVPDTCGLPLGHVGPHEFIPVASDSIVKAHRCERHRFEQVANELFGGDASKHLRRGQEFPEEYAEADVEAAWQVWQAATEGQQELLGALRKRQRKGHNDTCSRMVAGDAYECDCGFNEAEAVLARYGKLEGR